MGGEDYNHKIKGKRGRGRGGWDNKALAVLNLGVLLIRI